MNIFKGLKMKCQYNIVNRYNDSVIYSTEVEIDNSYHYNDVNYTLRSIAAKEAIKNNCNLNYANLSNIDLSDMNLTNINLTGADLSRTNLRNTNLEGACLRLVHLYRAYLVNANLSRADLKGAILTEANLTGTNFEETRGLEFQIPQEGELIVYKKTVEGIVKLRIPPEAKRTATPISRKCRAEFAEVLETPSPICRSINVPLFTYETGKIVKADFYNPDWRVECSGGIHFFLTEKEAEDY